MLERVNGGERRKREGERGDFIYFFLAFKTDGSLCAERKCLLTQLAHYWWLPANDNNGIGECEQQCSLLSSDACEQKDGSLQILLHGHPSLAVPAEAPITPLCGTLSISLLQVRVTGQNEAKSSGKEFKL